MKANKLIVIILIISSCAFGQKGQLDTFSGDELRQDFDLMVNSLKEAHGGLNWYTSAMEFDSICQLQRSKIKDTASSLDFYNLITPVVAFTREGHNSVSISRNISDYLKSRDLYLPILIKMIEKDVVLLNDVQGHQTKGYLIKRINGVPIEDVLEEVLKSIPADGYIVSGKYRRLNSNGLSNYYADLYDVLSDNSFTLFDPVTKETISIDAKSVDGRTIREIRSECFKDREKRSGQPISLGILNESTAVLRLNSFDQRRFDRGTSFEKSLDSLFGLIEENSIENLIIDLRYNRGGEEHYSALTYSYLTDLPFEQYEYVQTNAFDYSFFDFTNYESEENREELLGYLKEEHVKKMDGRILRKKTVLSPPAVKERAFTGNTYVLISGETYSAAALFASLVRSNTSATFIGQETGGCYYGNTGGFSIRLTLPTSKMKIRIPLLRFVNKVEPVFPLGRGIIPHHSVEVDIETYISGYDRELQLALDLIGK